MQCYVGLKRKFTKQKAPAMRALKLFYQLKNVLVTYEDSTNPI